MKIEGSLKDLVRVGDNKRNQLLPIVKKEKYIVDKELSQAQDKKYDLENSKAIKVGRPPIKNKNIKYVRTALELPESIKDDLDLLFLKFKKLKEKGKNEFMVEAIVDKIKSFTKLDS